MKFFKKLPFTKAARIYRAGHDRGYITRHDELIAQIKFLENQEALRQIENTARQKRIDTIEDNARTRAREIIERAHCDADDIIAQAKQKLIIASKNYNAIAAARDEIEAINDKTRSAVMDANRIFGDASQKIVTTKANIN